MICAILDGCEIQSASHSDTSEMQGNVMTGGS